MKILIYGSRQFGQVIQCLVEDCGHEFAGFIDDVYEGEGVLGPFTQTRLTHPPTEYSCVNAVGYSDLAARREVTARIQNAGYAMPVLVHPRRMCRRRHRSGLDRTSWLAHWWIAG